MIDYPAGGGLAIRPRLMCDQCNEPIVNLLKATGFWDEDKPNETVRVLHNECVTNEYDLRLESRGAVDLLKQVVEHATGKAAEQAEAVPMGDDEEE